MRDMKKKHNCENTIYFSQIIAYTNFERIVKRIILTGIFYSWNVLERMKPMN